MDFAFDHIADGRVIKCLAVVDDAMHESVAIVPERAIGGHALTRILDRLAVERGLSQAIRTDNGKEFCGRGDADLGAFTWREAVPDRAGQAQPEHLCRIVQWSLAGRMSERTLVRQPGARQDGDRGVAA